MLLELSMVEQRYQAVREVLDTGATITDVAGRYGVDRRTLHRWLTRYANEGLGGLVDRSHRPARSPLQMAPEVEARLLALRWLHPGWGPRTLRSKLAREFDPGPSRAAIYRALVRNNVIETQKRKRRASDYRRWERTKSMELWQMDVVGRIFLNDGTQLYAVTGVDDHSRFCVSAKLVFRATARPVTEALTEARGSRRSGPRNSIRKKAGGRRAAVDGHGVVVVRSRLREAAVRRRCIRRSSGDELQVPQKVR